MNTDVQHFLLRLAARAVEAGLFRRRDVRLYQPPARLFFESRLPVGTYKDVFVSEHYRSPVALPADARIVDGGANIGLSALYFLHRHPRARIEAYEANPPTAALLRKTLASADFAAGRYEIHEQALHTEDGTVPFYVDPAAAAEVNSSISGRDNLKERGERHDVPAIDFRRLLERPVDLLKLDVEGHEYHLLDLPGIVPATVRAMMVEFHEMDEHHDDCARLFARFADAGYRIEFAERPGVDATAPAAWTGTHILNIYAP